VIVDHRVRVAAVAAVAAFLLVLLGTNFMDEVDGAELARKSMSEPVNSASGLVPDRFPAGLGYTAQAAEDPFTGKPLLRRDPIHPGKVILTRLAKSRRDAYYAWLRRHRKNPLFNRFVHNSQESLGSAFSIHSILHDIFGTPKK